MSDLRSVEDGFGELIELKTAELRADYLRRLGLEDANLQGQLERLLEAHEKAGSFLQQDSFETTREFEPESLLNSSIGPYKLRERLGAGGMGVVWAAEQRLPLKRKVALKLIKPGMDSEQVIARFEAEREALSRMDHPHIARVLDAGTTEKGHPYFVMELIRGLPVTEYCDKKRLTIRERLELFTKICSAVQHAHQKGIIHRDIKPSNVLVSEQDGQPFPKVIDFGVAKALHQPLTDRSLYTGVFQALGTLQYMSPEQAGLSIADVDTRADVYGLGVLLYELLTGSTPFEKEQLASAAFDEACRIIREQEPPKPSTRLSTLGERALTISETRNTDPNQLSRLVRGDLDWIVTKSLDKDRSRRYESANSFAADVDRYLENEPIEARPPSIAYRVQKHWARHRAAVLMAAIVSILFTLFLASATWGYFEKKRTLDALHVQLIERGFELILIGDKTSFDTLLETADGAGVTKEWMHFLLGTWALHQGDNPTAKSFFDKALDENPGSTAAWALQSIVIRHIGREDRWEEHMDRQKEFPVRSRFENIDRLSLAYASFYVDFDQCATDMDEILKGHRSWFVARAVRGAALAESANDSGDSEQIAKAIEEIRVPYLVAQDNAFVQVIALFVHINRLRKFSETSDWLSSEATRIVAALNQRPNYDLATHMVADYYSVIDQPDQAQLKWKKLLTSGGFHSSRAIAELMRLGQYEVIRNYSPTDDPEAEIAKAWALALLDADDKMDALEIYERLQPIVTKDFLRFRLFQLLLLLGDEEEAEKMAKEWSMDRNSNRENAYAQLRQEIFQDMAGTDQLRTLQNLPVNQMVTNFYLALRARASGSLKDADKYLSAAVAANVGATDANWARTIQLIWNDDEVSDTVAEQHDRKPTY